MCNLRKLNKLEVSKQYQIKISNSFVCLENLSVSEDINRALENIRENIKTSANVCLSLFELKPLKPWIDEECLRFEIKGSRLKCSGYRTQIEAR